MLRALVVGILLVGAACDRDRPVVAASSPAGKVLEVAGKVSATRSGATRQLVASGEVFSDDVIDTAADGSVVIELFHNNARWTLEASLNARVDESVAWGLDKQAAAKLVEHATSSAGRHASRTAADTKESANQTPEVNAVVGAAPEQPVVPQTVKPTEPPKPEKPVTKEAKDERDRKKPDPKVAGKVADKDGFGGCDEVNCAIDPSGACCAKFKKRGDKKPAGNAPEDLKTDQLSQGIATAKPRVLACGDKHTAKGIVKVAVVVDAVGKVTSVTVKETPDRALGECVAAAMKTATFAKSSAGGTFSYKFQF